MDLLSTLTLAAESADKIQETVNATMFNVGDGNGIWYLIGAALVFFMQCGFAMVETGFTRAKNAGNIIMKNLMDFCLGTIAFVLLGFGLMLGEDTFFGLIGVPNLDVLTQLSSFDRCAEFVFNLVFCATAATIVSGAMAERTKFISYCIYSFVISLVVYPIEAHWIWAAAGSHSSASLTSQVQRQFIWSVVLRLLSVPQWSDRVSVSSARTASPELS